MDLSPLSPGRLDRFVLLVGEELMQTQELMLRLLSGESVPEGTEEQLHRADRYRRILTTLGDETLSIGQLVQRMPRIKRPTLKGDLKALLSDGQLARTGAGRGVVYRRV